MSRYGQALPEDALQVVDAIEPEFRVFNRFGGPPGHGYSLTVAPRRLSAAIGCECFLNNACIAALNFVALGDTGVPRMAGWRAAGAQ